MEYYVHNKPNIRTYFILLFLPVYVGFCLGNLYGTDLYAQDVTVRIIRSLIFFWKIRITPLSPI